MSPLQRYNQARDLEQRAFECTPLGEQVRNAHNAALRGAIAGLPVEMVAGLATLVAFAPYSGAMPAFYAGRALRLW